MGLSFTIAAGLRQPFSGLSPAGLMTIFLLPQIRDSPNLGCQGPVFMSHRNRVARLYSSAQGGGIRPRFDTGYSQSQSVLMAAGPRYIASARTAQKTLLPTALLLGDVAIRTDRTKNRLH
jgi:hypothetical protein